MWIVIEDGKRKVKSNELPRFEQIQKIVGGYVQEFQLGKLNSGRHATILFNEEGRLMELKPNFFYAPADAVIVGPAVIVGSDPIRGIFTHLDEKDVNQIKLLGTSMGVPMLIVEE